MPAASDGVNDMFWAEPWDEEAAAAACKVRQRALRPVNKMDAPGIKASPELQGERRLLAAGCGMQAAAWRRQQLRSMA